jgi:hypothetical protein
MRKLADWFFRIAGCGLVFGFMFMVTLAIWDQSHIWAIFFWPITAVVLYWIWHMIFDIIFGV